MEDLRSQLVCKTELEQKMLEDNRQLQQMVMRVDTEKKRLSMENEQLSWKMSQSFIGGEEFPVVNTPDGELDASQLIVDHDRKYSQHFMRTFSGKNPAQVS